MKFATKLSIMICACVSSHALTATLNVPINMDLIYLDHQELHLSGSNRDVPLSDGSHRLLLRYSEVIGKKANRTKVTSDPIIVYFDAPADDSKLTLVGETPHNLRLAKKYAENPKFTIIDALGNPITIKRRPLPSQEGYQLSRDFLVEMAALELSEANQESLKHQQDQAASNIELAMLKQWYEKADEVSRKAFRVWIIDPTRNSRSAPMESQALKTLKFWHQKADTATHKAFQLWLLQ
jgi:uncharacterized protein YccT (UPF0319 family)